MCEKVALLVEVLIFYSVASQSVFECLQIFFLVQLDAYYRGSFFAVILFGVLQIGAVVVISQYLIDKLFERARALRKVDEEIVL